MDIAHLVPEDHLLRKIEKIMDYGWLHERLSPYYCHDVERDESDPDCGMLVKGEHKKQLAYKAPTACDRNGMVLAAGGLPAPRRVRFLLFG